MRNVILSSTLALLTAASALLSTGCVNDAEGNDGAAMSDSLNREQKIAFEAGQDIWWGSKPTSYSFQVSRNCVCFPYGWMEVFVDEDKVVKIDTVDGLESPSDLESFREAPNMDQIFDQIEKYLDDPEYEVKAAYDTRVGYPTSVSIHRVGNYQDAVVEFQIAGFRL